MPSKVVNCVNCGCGSVWWLENAICPECKGHPLVAGTSAPDWKNRRHAEFIHKFGERVPGDHDLAEKYPAITDK
jgi:hypothetical protein